MTLIIGVDPGITGALAIWRDGTIAAVYDMPVIDGQTDGGAVATLFRNAQPDWVVVEQVHPMPKNGSIASFSLGKNYGIVIGVAMAGAHPLVKIRPSEWKRRSGLLKQPKEASRRLATELWPQHAEQFRRVRDDGRAEAALIARAHASTLIHAANGEGE